MLTHIEYEPQCINKITLPVCDGTNNSTAKILHYHMYDVMIVMANHDKTPVIDCHISIITAIYLL